MNCVISHLGPNASLTGDISNDYFKYSSVDPIKEILIFFFVSSDILALSLIILLKICGINSSKVFVELRKQLGLTFSDQMALGLYAVRFSQKDKNGTSLIVLMISDIRMFKNSTIFFSS